MESTMTHRRGFMKTLVGAFVASAIEIRLATAPVLPVSLESTLPTSVLTNAKLDEIYQMLLAGAKEAWGDRYRQAYHEMSES